MAEYSVILVEDDSEVRERLAHLIDQAHEDGR